MKKKIILIVIALILVVPQFFRIDKTNPESKPENDFLQFTKAPSEIVQIMKTSCYDCHSNTTKYPWYSNVAPVSWLLKAHIDDGRKHLNFSTWGEFSVDKQIHKIEECIEEVSEGKMPLKQYTKMHKEAVLSKESQTALLNWFKTIDKGINNN